MARVTIRLTDQLERLAKKQAGNVPLAVWVRNLVAAELGQPEPEHKPGNPALQSKRKASAHGKAAAAKRWQCKIGPCKKTQTQPCVVCGKPICANHTAIGWHERKPRCRKCMSD